MKRIITFWVFLLTAGGSLLAQDENKFFEFWPLKKCKQVKSLYKSIDFLDTRTDTSCIGILKATQKKTVRAVLLTPVQPQLATLLDKYAAPGAGDGELLFQLRRFSWAEPFKTRYVYLAATLYARRGDRYLRLANLDSAIVVTFASEVENELIDQCEHVLYNFLAKNIGSAPAEGVSYSMDDLLHIDSLEKRQIPVYNSPAYVDGLYGTYEAFKVQQPDLQGEVKTHDDGTPSAIKVADRHWKEKHDHIYALVYKGVPYMVTHLGIWPLQKDGDELYFTGRLRTAITDGERGAASFMVGMIGEAAVASAGDRLVCKSMIDHQNGEFIHLKVMETDAQ